LSSVVVLVVSLTSGAFLTILALTSQILWQPLPYPNAERLVSVDHSAPGLNVASGYGVSKGLVHAYRGQPGVDNIAIYQEGIDVTIVAGGSAERISSTRVDEALAELLGIRPQYGRWISEADALDGAKVVVLTPAVASKLFGLPSEAIGKVIELDETPFEVVGVVVAPRIFGGRADAFTPISAGPPDRVGGFGLRAIARLKPDADQQLVQTQMTTVISDMSAWFPDDAVGIATASRAHLVPIVTPLKDKLNASVRLPLLLLFAATIVLLLIAFSNLAHLFLVRADARRHEWSVQVALGASRSSIVRGVLSESLVLSSIGVMIGLGLASAATRWVTQHLSLYLSGLEVVAIGATERLAGVLLAGSLAVAIALVGSRQGGQGATALSGGGRDAVQQSSPRWRLGLISAQAGSSVVLVAMALLMLASVDRMLAVPLGFEPSQRVATRVNLPVGFVSQGRAESFHRSLLERLREQPGLREVSLTNRLPLVDAATSAAIELRVAPMDGLESPSAEIRTAGPGLVSTMGIPILAGRDFRQDDMDHPEAVVVNNAFVLRFLSGQNPVGMHLRRVGGSFPWMPIVGVVATTASGTHVAEATRPAIYIPYTSPSARTSITDVWYVAHTGATPAQFYDAVASSAQQLTPVAVARSPLSLDGLTLKATGDLRLVADLLLFTALTSLAMASIGIYGTVAYSVQLRRRELVLRQVLGASASSIACLVLIANLVPVGFGTALGVAAGLLLGATARSLFFGITWYEPQAYVAAAAIVLVVAFIAAWAPLFRHPSRSLTQGLK
jgi:predicted permease